MVQRAAQQAQIRHERRDARLGDDPIEREHRLVACRRVRRDRRDHRILFSHHARARLDAALDAHAARRRGRPAHVVGAAWERAAVDRVHRRIDARLHRVARRLRAQHRVGDALAEREHHLDLDEIHVRAHLDQRVLGREARHEADEVERAARIDEELNGPDAAEAGVRDQIERGRPDRGAHFFATMQRIDRRRGRLAQHPAVILARAGLEIAQHADVALAVRGDLHFHVARAIDVPLEDDRGAVELERREMRFQLLVVLAHQQHARLRDADGALDHHRKAHALRFHACIADGRSSDVARGQHPHARFFGGGAQGEPVAMEHERLGVRPDEHDARLLAAPRQLEALVEEAVAGMDRLAAVRDRGRHDHGRVGVVLGRADVRDRIARLRVDRFLFSVGTGGDGVGPEATAGAGHAGRDFATTGDEDLLEHGRESSPSATGSTRTRASGSTNGSGTESGVRECGSRCMRAVRARA